MGLTESMAITNPLAAALFPMQIGMALWILCGALVLSLIAILLSTAPPSSLLRRIRGGRRLPGMREASAPA